MQAAHTHTHTSVQTRCQHFRDRANIFVQTLPFHADNYAGRLAATTILQQLPPPPPQPPLPPPCTFPTKACAHTSDAIGDTGQERVGGASHTILKGATQRQ